MIRNTVLAPILEPISLGEAKAHLRVDGTDEDGLIQALIVTAREMVETYTGRLLMRQTLDLVFDEFADPLYLAAPLISVTSITYVDATGAPQVIAPSDYVVVAPTKAPEPIGFVHPAHGVSWPTPRDQRGAVTVRAVFGALQPRDVPGAIRSAMLLAIGDLYQNREAQSDAPLITNLTQQRLLFPWVVTWH